jgi:hypothetical protein
VCFKIGLLEDEVSIQIDLRGLRRHEQRRTGKKQQPQKSADGGESGPLVVSGERVVSARGGNRVLASRFGRSLRIDGHRCGGQEGCLLIKPAIWRVAPWLIMDTLRAPFTELWRRAISGATTYGSSRSIPITLPSPSSLSHTSVPELPVTRVIA